MEFLERKAETLKCADEIREELARCEIKARVYCVWYKRASPTNLLCVSPNGASFLALNHWEQKAYKKGLEFYLKVGNNLEERFKHSTKISVN